MNRFFLILSAIVILGGAVVGGLFGRLPNSLMSLTGGESAVEKIRNDYQESLKVVEQNYVDKLDREKVTESSIQGMLYTLDPHSSFFTRKEFQKLYEDQSSKFYGIGVSIVGHRDGVYIQSLVENTPAYEAGLKYGDRIIEVDGKDAREWSSQEVSNNVRGERGTPVRVKVERAGVKTPLEFKIIRDAVPYPSIRGYFMIRPEIGYVGLVGGFQETTAEELSDALKDLKKQGMKQLVLDLRGNPGGLLPQAIEVVSRFVPQGQVVTSVRGRSKYARNEDYKANGDDYHEDLPLVILINHYSASASEVVSGAIQDYGRGLIVGETSFGKGLVQRVFPLTMGTGLTLTTARYYTPYGRSLQRDYSNGSIYEYYVQHSSQNSSNKNATAQTSEKTTPAVTTAGGRVFYGGAGITPDIVTEPLKFNTLRSRIAEAAFYFTRQLSTGQVAGLEEYRVDRTTFNHILRPTDFPITDQVVQAFLNFVNKDAEDGLTAEQVNKDLDFAKTRLREEIVTAAYATETGQQVLLDVDPQVLKAVEVLPEAKKLAESMKNNSVIKAG
jgi:carboxyl-terminal processing protease